MAGNAGFMQLFLAKGEKIILFAAIGLTALLLLLGVMSLIGTTDPKEKSKTLTDAATSMRRNMDNEEIPTNVTSVPEPAVEFKPIPFSEYQSSGVIYEMTAWPNLRRDNPIALSPIDDQIDLITGATIMLAREFTARKPGDEVKDFMMAVRKTVDKNAVDPKVIRDLLKNPKKPGLPRKPNPPPAGGGPAGAGGPGGGGFPGGPGGPAGPGGGFPGGAGGPMGPGMPGGSGGLFAGGKTTETAIEWIKYSEWEKKPFGTPAYSVYPIRMGVVHMSFPLQKQLEEIRKALRLKSIARTVAEAGPDTMMAKHPETGKPILYSEYVKLLGGSLPPAASGAGPGGPGMPGMPGMPGGGMPGTPGMPGGGGPSRPPSGGMFPGGPAGAGNPPAGGESGPALTLNSAMAAPVFSGFVVERREVMRDGKPGVWYPFDHVENYSEQFEIYEAKTIPEGGFMPNFLRPEVGQDMSFPMPELSKNWTSIPQGPLPAGMVIDKPKYPVEIRMPSIILDWKALEAANVKPTKQSDYLKRLGAARQPKSFGDSNSGTGGSTGISDFNPDGGTNTGNSTLNDPNKLPVGHMLIRFMDTKLEPGATYQYRVKIRFRNPNYAKPKDMAIEKLADEEFIESNFYELKHSLRVPNEDFVFATSQRSYEEHIGEILKHYGEAESNKLANKQAESQLKKMYELDDVKAADPKQPRKAVLQMQRWMPQVLIGDTVEPVGGWVQAEIPVGIGEYIGKKVLVELPLWRANEDKYILSEMPKPTITNWPKKEQAAAPPLMPVGRPLDFSTQSVLLDFEGGKLNYRPSPNASSINDESTTELLILREDGRIEVRKEAVDVVNKARLARETGWKEWIAAVKKDSPSLHSQGSGQEPGSGSGKNGR